MLLCLRGEPMCHTLRLRLSQRRAHTLSLRFNLNLLFKEFNQLHLKEPRCQATTPSRAAAPWAPVLLHPGGGRAQAQLRSLA